MDMWMTSSATRHVSAVLHCSSSFKHCCILGGLLPWSVKCSSNWFQALCCSSSLSSQDGGASAVDKDDDVDRPHPRAGSSSARDDNPRIVRHVSHLARVRETSQDSPVTQKRTDPSSCEMDPPLVRRLASHRPSPPLECPSLSPLTLVECHALYVLALQCVVARLAIRLHSSFSEECLHHDLHVFSRSSRNPCSSRSMAVGCARPYLRSASVCPSASRTSNRFSGETMFAVILLMSALYVIVQPAESNLVADLVRQKGFQSGPVCR